MYNGFIMSEVLLPHSEYEPVLPTGSLIILTGPSGAGKDTIMNELLIDPELSMDRIVTYASRDPRPGEIDGVDYHFVSSLQFEEMIAQEQLAEWVRFGSTYKGTPKEPFNDVLSGNGNYIWRIDPSRAAQIEEFFEETFEPSVAEELKARTMKLYVGLSRLTLLKDRYSQREETFDREEFIARLKPDWEIWQQFSATFPHIILNDGTVEESVAADKQMISQHFV